MKEQIEDTKDTGYKNVSIEVLNAAIERYKNEGNEALEDIASSLGKSTKSIRAKLVAMKVYKADPKPTKVAKELGPTKKELIAAFCKDAGIDFLDGLTSATKEAITTIHKVVLDAKK